MTKKINHVLYFSTKIHRVASKIYKKYLFIVNKSFYHDTSTAQKKYQKNSLRAIVTWNTLVWSSFDKFKTK